MLILVFVLMFVEKGVDSMRWRHGCIPEMISSIELSEMEVDRDEARYSFNSL